MAANKNGTPRTMMTDLKTLRRLFNLWGCMAPPSPAARAAASTEFDPSWQIVLLGVLDSLP
jgi:hypothetical protein